MIAKEVIQLEDARSLGLNTYFTGRPCKRGGIAERYVSSRQCLCEKCLDSVAQRRSGFYKENRIRLLENSKRWQKENKESVNAYMRARRKANPHIKADHDRRYHEKNKALIAERARLYREMNQETISARKKRWSEKNSDVIKERRAEYRSENREVILERYRIYRQKNAALLSYRSRQHYEANKEYVLERNKRYRESNRDKLSAWRFAYSVKNKGSAIQRVRLWRERNPNLLQANSAKRRAATSERLPVWFGEFDQFVMQEAADVASRRAISTGVAWHVDHMVPLLCKIASGFHCGNNLQVIPAVLNLKKGSKLWLHETGQWLKHI